VEASVSGRNLQHLCLVRDARAACVPPGGVPFPGRTNEVYELQTFKFLHLLTGDHILFNSVEVTELTEEWGNLVVDSDFRGALNLVEATVKLMCKTLLELVAEREALAFRKQARDDAHTKLLAELQAKREAAREALA
jgi:hypothetical protein